MDNLPNNVIFWSLINGVLVAFLIFVLGIHRSPKIIFFASITTIAAILLWNWSMNFNGSVVNLDIDARYLRISWADALDTISVYALTSFVMATFILRDEKGKKVAAIAGIAALITLLTDTFLF